MIALLQGRLERAGEQHYILTQVGVGYAITPSPDLLNRLGQAATDFHIYTHSTDRSTELFAFSQAGDRELFKRMIAVSGLGPKTAIAAFHSGAGRILAAVSSAELSFFTQLPRVGKKLAQKIIVELQPRGQELAKLIGPQLSPTKAGALEGLQQLGFAEEKVQPLLRELDESLSEAELIRSLLQKLGEEGA